MAYKGFDKKLGIEIAWLKVSTSMHLSEEDKARIQREVQILKGINNPFIIKVRGYWVRVDWNQWSNDFLISLHEIA